MHFIPIASPVVFDKVTGRIYTEFRYLEPNSVHVNDFINKNSELYQMDNKIYGKFTPKWKAIESILKEQEKEKTLQLYRAIK